MGENDAEQPRGPAGSDQALGPLPRPSFRLRLTWLDKREQVENLLVSRIYGHT